MGVGDLSCPGQISTLNEHIEQHPRMIQCSRTEIVWVSHKQHIRSVEIWRPATVDAGLLLMALYPPFLVSLSEFLAFAHLCFLSPKYDVVTTAVVREIREVRDLALLPF